MWIPALVSFLKTSNSFGPTDRPRRCQGLDKQYRLSSGKQYGSKKDEFDPQEVFYFYS